MGKPAANRASVTAVYADQVTEKETVFTRIIRGSSSDHSINGRVRLIVTFTLCFKEMKSRYCNHFVLLLNSCRGMCLHKLKCSP